MRGTAVPRANRERVRGSASYAAPARRDYAEDCGTPRQPGRSTRKSVVRGAGGAGLRGGPRYPRQPGRSMRKSILLRAGGAGLRGGARYPAPTGRYRAEDRGAPRRPGFRVQRTAVPRALNTRPRYSGPRMAQRARQPPRSRTRRLERSRAGSISVWLASARALRPSRRRRRWRRRRRAGAASCSAAVRRLGFGSPPRGRRNGESHSPVVHELWVLVVAGSNPASPTLVSQAVPYTWPFAPMRSGVSAGETRSSGSAASTSLKPSRTASASVVLKEARPARCSVSSGSSPFVPPLWRWGVSAVERRPVQNLPLDDLSPKLGLDEHDAGDSSTKDADGHRDRSARRLVAQRGGATRRVAGAGHG
jgi:hypothetical protein